MKHFLFFVLFTLAGFKTYAQHTDLYIIKLKNGMIIKAELVKVVTDSFAIIKQYGLESKIKMSEILDITFNETNPTVYLAKGTPPVLRRNLPDSDWSVGYQVGFTLGLVDYGATSSFVTRFTALKTVARKTQVGFSLGLDPYAAYDFVIGTIAADIRQYFINNARAPFVYGYVGYGFNITNSKPIQSGGINYGFGFGQSFRTKRQKTFSFMLGLKGQNAEDYSFFWNGSNNLQYYSMRRLELKLESLF